MTLYLQHMKKIFAILLSSVFFIYPSNVEAGHFTCSVSNVTANSAEVDVISNSTAITSEFIYLLNEGETNHNEKMSGTITGQTPTTATYKFQNLGHSTTYLANAYNGAGDYVESIKGCIVKTLGAGQQAATSQANPSNQPLGSTNVPNPQSGSTNTPNPQSGSTNVPNPQSGTAGTKTNTAGGSGGGFILDVKLKNPLKVDTIEGAIKFFVNTLIKIAIPFIVVFFIWSGLKFILARGKPDEIVKAKQMFWYTIIGTLLILGAWTITNAIIGTVNSITN